MASITTQTIGSAVAQTVSPSATAISREAGNIANQRQVQQASQAESDRTTLTPRARDRDRAPQVPKRTEAGYAPQNLKAKGESDDNSPKEREGIDIQA